jgi:hypothetical protein
MAKKIDFGIADCISANIEITFTGEASTNQFAIELVDDCLFLGTERISVDCIDEFVALLLHVQHRVNTLKKSFDLEK